MLFFTLVLFCLCSKSCLCFGSEEGPSTGSWPRFIEPLKNVTVVEGKNAEFPCLVENLGKYKVGWVRVETETILAISTTVYNRDPRFSVTTNDNGTRWTLEISNVRRSDSGRYVCQYNTDPMKSTLAYLDVLVPPDIIFDESSADVTVVEGKNTGLICRASGHPKPIISWQREDSLPMRLNKHRGEVLRFPKIDRSQAGAYLCIASNGVPPAVSRRIVVAVHFQPTVQDPFKFIPAQEGEDVSIDCISYASPSGITYWTKKSGEQITSNEKFKVTEKQITEYGVQTTLEIKNVTQDSDFEDYKCVTENYLGHSHGIVRLINSETLRRFPLEPSSYNETSDEEQNSVVKSIIVQRNCTCYCQ